MKAQQPWYLLVINLTGVKSSSRVRIWRGIKACGAAALRDGVYLLPGSESSHQAFVATADDIRQRGGCCYFFQLSHEAAEKEQELIKLFDRSTQYLELQNKIYELQAQLEDMMEAEASKRITQLQRELSHLRSIDFYPTSHQQDCHDKLMLLHQRSVRNFSPDEPNAVNIEIPRFQTSEFRHRVWATRCNMWIDRVASAWLIRRFIDPEAVFLWLASPADCPADALGFDFDGASFTHIGERVTFEVLLISFCLEHDTALVRMAKLVHYLDVGGEHVAEAEGLISILGGIKSRCADDDTFLSESARMFDDLYTGFSKET